MKESEIDPREFLERLKTEHQVLQWEPLEPASERLYRENEQARSGAALEYLHHNWVLPDRFDSSASGTGARGRVVSVFGHLVFRVLGPYLRAERDLLSHVVQVSDSLERRCDELTLRCQQLNQDLIDRQVAEAKNLAELALWLHLDPPASARRGDPDGRPAGPDAEPSR